MGDQGHTTSYTGGPKGQLRAEALRSLGDAKRRSFNDLHKQHRANLIGKVVGILRSTPVYLKNPRRDYDGEVLAKLFLRIWKSRSGYAGHGFPIQVMNSIISQKRRIERGKNWTGAPKRICITLNQIKSLRDIADRGDRENPDSEVRANSKTETAP